MTGAGGILAPATMRYKADGAALPAFEADGTWRLGDMETDWGQICLLQVSSSPSLPVFCLLRQRLALRFRGEPDEDHADEVDGADVAAGHRVAAVHAGVRFDAR